MPNRVLLASLLVACLSLAACGPAPQPGASEATVVSPEGDAIARWNDEVPILRSDYESWLDWRGRTADADSLGRRSRRGAAAQDLRRETESGRTEPRPAT